MYFRPDHDIVADFLPEIINLHCRIHGTFDTVTTVTVQAAYLPLGGIRA